MHLKSLFQMIIVTLICSSVQARNLYVSSSKGNDKNDGTSLEGAFKTIQYAAQVCQPGDTILIAAGIYQSNSKHLLKIDRSGLPNQWIVYKNLENERPILYVSNETGIYFHWVAYVAVEGLEITIHPDFASKNINPDQPSNLTSKGLGILIERSRDDINLNHHLRIKNCYIHHCPGTAIDVFSCDYLEIKYNIIHANGQFNMVNNYGIRLQFLASFDQQKTDHISITHNSISEQRQWGSLSKINSSCEENYGASGIVIRNNRFDPVIALKTTYTLPIHISNNIIYLNGGEAIDLFETNSITIDNNTIYQNNQNLESTCGEIVMNRIKDVKIFNNIIFTRLNMTGSLVSNFENVQFRNNLYYNTSRYHKGEKDLILDPLFTKTDLHSGEFNFDLRPKSPCINTGILDQPEAVDYSGTKRVINGYIDLGALEYTGALPSSRDHDLIRLDKRHMIVSWQHSYIQGTGQIIVQNSKGDKFCARLFNSKGILMEQFLEVDGSKQGVEFDVSGLPNGMYFIMAYSRTDKTYTRYNVINEFSNMLKK